MKTLILRHRVIRPVAAALLLLLTLTVGGTWWIGESLVAPHRMPIGDPPAELGISSFRLASESGAQLAGWQTHPADSDAVVVLIHGIHGSRVSMLDRARMLHQHGYATVMIDLRAHGESTGESITIGHLEKHDVRAAVAYARREYPNKPIGVIGVSLGGAAALLGSPLDIDALILESVFSDIEHAIDNRVAARLGPISSLPTSILLLQMQMRLGISPEQLCPIDCIQRADCPVFVLSGTDDPHTTASETIAIHTAAQAPKGLWLVEDAKHVDLFQFAPEQYQQRVLNFLATHLQ